MEDTEEGCGARKKSRKTPSGAWQRGGGHEHQMWIPCSPLPLLSSIVEEEQASLRDGDLLRALVGGSCIRDQAQDIASLSGKSRDPHGH